MKKSDNSTVHLKMATTRIKLHKTKITEDTKNQRKIIIELLREGKDRIAEAKAYQILSNNLKLELLNAIELYCELLIARMPLLNSAQFDFSTKIIDLLLISNRVCPKELRPAVVGIILSVQSADIDELATVSKH